MAELGTQVTSVAMAVLTLRVRFEEVVLTRFRFATAELDQDPEQMHEGRSIQQETDQECLFSHYQGRRESNEARASGPKKDEAPFLYIGFSPGLVVALAVRSETCLLWN